MPSLSCEVFARAIKQPCEISCEVFIPAGNFSSELFFERAFARGNFVFVREFVRAFGGSEMTFKKKVCQIDIAHDTGVRYGMDLIRQVFDHIEDDVTGAALAGAMSYIAFSMGANSTNPEESEKALFKMFQFSEIKFHEGVEAMERYKNGELQGESKNVH